MEIRRYLKLAGLLLKFRLNRQMIYSFNFWAALLVDLSVFLIQIAVFSTIFLQVDDINGWNRHPLIFFVGTFTILDSLWMCSYFFGVIGIPEKILTGKLDIYIARPINTLFFVSFENMDLGSFFLTIPGIMMLVYSAAKLKIAVTPGKIFGYMLLICVMLILIFNLMVILRSAAFWVARVDSLNDFENEMINFSFRVPGIVYKGLTKVIFYLILPYGLLATIPTQFFTGMLEGRYWCLTSLVCVMFTFGSQFIWKLGLKRYGSASS